MKNRLPPWLKIVLGISLILFGAIGHLIPLLPGMLFITAGALLLAEVSPRVRRALTALENRYPKFSRAIGRIRTPDGSLDLAKIAIPLIVIAILFMAFGYWIYRLAPWK
jgi:uncharacterized membrane protein YbaN (DUF454 family)